MATQLNIIRTAHDLVVRGPGGQVAFDWETFGDAIELLIALRDISTPDADLESNGDELDGTSAEDDFCYHGGDVSGGAGCPISDPDTAVDDIACDGEGDVL